MAASQTLQSTGESPVTRVSCRGRCSGTEAQAESRSCPAGALTLGAECVVDSVHFHLNSS
ncbi:Uncharacterized protein DAT39_022856 [Clarias magur]|uniref:Uncharacterized protein n=1 Tax=Clarias magur TaxID=1594786 RepID=A0A8J4WPP2_CLAMG|nr:Uncharacterized protein DAT39_022856 [Clarias magur]